MAVQKWMLYTKRADFEKISARFLISPLTARILINRDVSEEEMENFLQGDWRHLHSPRLMKGMEEALDVLSRKTDAKKKIRVVGDYDIDGVCATYIYCAALQRIGAEVDYEIPDRVKDGYGINMSIVEAAYRDGVDTILTCDNGIAAFEALKKAKELGMYVIVTDHHEVFREEEREQLPEADIIINPKQSGCTYPYKDICGAMIAYKLASLLFEKYRIGEREQRELADFAAIATIGDVMPLRDENRSLVKHCLNRLTNTANIGLEALIRVCELEGKEIHSYHVGFILGPCINAGGRLDSAKLALALFMEKDKERAYMAAVRLKELNDKRKELTRENFRKARILVEENHISDKVLVIYLGDCHESIAGIIAGRIKEEYQKPTFVLTDTQEGLLKGSGRSIEAYPMFEKLREVDSLLIKYGGHPMAAGLSMQQEKLEEFRKMMNHNAKLNEEDFIEEIWIDAAMPFSYISEELIREFKMLAPFGYGNPKPVFARKNIEILDVKVLGSKRNTVKLRLKDSDSCIMNGICFCEGDDFLRECYAHKNIAIIYYPEINEYMGRKEIQIIIKYWKFS